MLNPATRLKLCVGLPIHVLPLLVGKGTEKPADMHEVELLWPGPGFCDVVYLEDTVGRNPGLRRWVEIYAVNDYCDLVSE